MFIIKILNWLVNPIKLSKNNRLERHKSMKVLKNRIIIYIKVKNNRNQSRIIKNIIIEIIQLNMDNIKTLIIVI